MTSALPPSGSSPVGDNSQVSGTHPKSTQQPVPNPIDKVAEASVKILTSARGKSEGSMPGAATVSSSSISPALDILKPDAAKSMANREIELKKNADQLQIDSAKDPLSPIEEESGTAVYIQKNLVVKTDPIEVVKSPLCSRVLDLAGLSNAAPASIKAKATVILKDQDEKLILQSSDDKIVINRDAEEDLIKKPQLSKDKSTIKCRIEGQPTTLELVEGTEDVYTEVDRSNIPSPTKSNKDSSDSSSEDSDSDSSSDEEKFESKQEYQLVWYADDAKKTLFLLPLSDEAGEQTTVQEDDEGAEYIELEGNKYFLEDDEWVGKDVECMVQERIENVFVGKNPRHHLTIVPPVLSAATLAALNTPEKRKQAIDPSSKLASEFKDQSDSIKKYDELQTFYDDIEFKPFAECFLGIMLLGMQDAKVINLKESNVLFSERTDENGQRKLSPKLIDMGPGSFPASTDYSTTLGHDDSSLEADFKTKTHSVRNGLMAFPQARMKLVENAEGNAGSIVKSKIQGIIDNEDKILSCLKEASKMDQLNLEPQDRIQDENIRARKDVIQKMKTFLKNLESNPEKDWTLEEFMFAVYPEYEKQWKLLEKDEHLQPGDYKAMTADQKQFYVAPMLAQYVGQYAPSAVEKQLSRRTLQK